MRSKLRTVQIDWFKLLLLLAVVLIAGLFRFGVPTRPEQNLVFDEAYFVPQTESYAVNRYFFDIHPPVGRMALYYGMKLVNPDAAELLQPEKLGNKVDNYSTPLDLDGIRLFPKVFGTLLPGILFLFIFELLAWGKRRPQISVYVTSLLVGLMFALENSLILDSRYALLTPMLLVFMFGACLCGVKYFHATGKWRKLSWFVLCVLFAGIAVATKWLALSILPFLIILIAYRDWQDLASLKKWRRILATATNVLILIYMVLVLQVAAFAWHSDKIWHYSPAAKETSVEYKADLMAGTREVSLWKRFNEWFFLSQKYNDHVPKLDYAKPGEIGSSWATWPLMARPINYYNETVAEDRKAFLYSVGNPAVWAFGLLGILLLASVVANALLTGTKLMGKHALIVLLYFANWLPFIFISRVMYIYHYIPALIVSLLAFGIVWEEFLLPRLVEGLQKLFAARKINTADSRLIVMLVCFALLLALVGFSFYVYSVFTYMLPITESEFEARVLLKEWNMRY